MNASTSTPTQDPELGPSAAIDESFPENTTRAWITLFGCFCSFFSALSLMNSAGAFQSWISTHQLAGVDPGKIGWIFGFYNFFSFFAASKIGPLFDRYGPRPLSTMGLILCVVSYLLMAQCTQYWHFFLDIGVVGGLSTCLLFTSALGTVQHWFLKRRGLATGLAISGGSVGGIVLPLVLQRLLPAVGFAWTARAAAAIYLPFSLAGVVLMTGRFKSEAKLTLLPDLTVLLEARVLALTCGVFFVELAFFVPVTYLSSYALRKGLSTQTSFLLLTILNVGSLLGRWLPGYLGDKLGRFNTQIVAISACLAAILGLWLPSDGAKSWLISFALLFGLASGSNISLTPVCIAQLCPTEQYGRYYSSIYTVSSFGSLIGVPIAGQLISALDGEYLGLMLFAAAAYVIAFVCFTVVRLWKTGLVLRKRF
ncbi:MFS transporter, MCP family, solute carrier family 16, member 10 [Lophiostoma macrostomum CBS 122681]|uniref:MFS transporter, MCP family, solute carrier family 16, member 10 n=1 Tax=Lophiostoma macrostomum CBS 122681 TaxID=1314788 RepID=A0A6A6SU77_9PLEO|nr:MFS transporter, MCP family, solute carrier family 16, member 10 [Lophiostoma macrostomum CBS 122681]